MDEETGCNSTNVTRRNTVCQNRLSGPWMLQVVAKSLPYSKTRILSLRASSRIHLRAPSLDGRDTRLLETRKLMTVLPPQWMSEAAMALYLPMNPVQNRLGPSTLRNVHLHPSKSVLQVSSTMVIQSSRTSACCANILPPGLTEF